MSNLFDGPCIAGLVASTFAGLAWWRYRAAGAEYAAIQAADIFVGSGDQIERLKSSGIITLAVVSGRCFAEGNITKSSEDEIENALCLKTVVREVRRVWSRFSSQWEDEKHTVSTISKYLPVVIQTPNCAVSVKEPGRMDQVDLPVKMVKFEPYQSTIIDALSIFWKGEEVKGLETIQEALVEGTEVTGVGELVSSNTGIELRQPKKGLPFVMLASSISGLVRHYQDRIDPWKKIAIFFSLLSCGFFSYWSYKRLKALYNWYLQRKQRVLAQNVSSDVLLEQTSQVLQCVICLERQKNTLILPCGHFCSCKDCISMVDKCPVCRVEIESTLPFYNS